MKKSFSYRNLLLEEFDRRQRRNASYSLRAFARDIGVSPAKLCQIFKGKSGLSGQRATLVADKLGFDGELKDYFIALVETSHARSKAAKLNAKARLKELAELKGFDEITLDSFGIISDWIHFAILELLEVDSFAPSSVNIAKRLGVSESSVEVAVSRLKKTGLLEVNEKNQWRQTKRDLETPTNIPSKAIRDYHSQILNRAEKSIAQDDIDIRDFGALTLAFRTDQLVEAKKMIKEFRREFNRRFGNRKNKDSVYCLSTQLFPLDQHQNMEKP